MGILSLLLACAFVLAGPSIAGSSEGGLPGAGAFSYIGWTAAQGADDRGRDIGLLA